jgi:hypothetical protein
VDYTPVRWVTLSGDLLVIPVNDTGFRDDLVVTFGGEWSF